MRKRTHRLTLDTAYMHVVLHVVLASEDLAEGMCEP
jgi:hypothetical protein